MEERLRWFTWMRRRLTGACLAMLLLGMGTAGPSHGQGMVKPEWVMPVHYPNGFDGMGRITRISIEDGEVVIDDSAMALSSFARYHTPDDIDTSGYYFKVGMTVGYIIGPDSKIISMWQIKKE